MSFITRFVLFLLLNSLSILTVSAIQPNDTGSSVEPQQIDQEELESLQKTLNSLQLLIESKQEKTQEIGQYLKKLKQRAKKIKQKKQDRSIDEMQQELKDLEYQLQVTVTGISQKDYEGKVIKKFNLQEELETILQPLVHALKTATEDSRQIEELRQDIDLVEQKLDISKTVVKRITALKQYTNNDKLLSILDALHEKWKEEVEELSEELTVYNNIMSNKLAAQDSVMVATSGVFIEFFKHRGLHLLFGLLAFAAVIGISLLLKYLYHKIPWFKVDKRSTFARLISLIYVVITVAAAFMAMLFIFNYFNDWLLVGFSVLIIIAILWIILKSLPVILQQATLLLNLGSVREGERIVYQDIPWKVEKLSFYSTLKNPVLAGGTLQISCRELVGMVTRGISAKEQWFPTKEGDWVKLEDDLVGQIKYQSPEMVEIEDFGTSRITYPTQAYLSLNPMNLSKGYRIQTVFGIDYRYQKDMLTSIPDKMFEILYEDLKELLGAGEIKRVTTDFWMAADSSLQYEYEAYIKGSSAHMYEEVERVIIYAFGKVCNQYKIVIPFPQITYHKGPPA